MSTAFISSLSSHAAAFFSSHPEMPAKQDWRVTPWAAVDAAFAAKCGGDGQVDDDWEKEVEAFFRARLLSSSSSSSLDWSRQVPSLNESSQHQLVDGQVVRFRCMVQDMFDPEYYFSVFQVRDLSTGKVTVDNMV